MGVGRKYPLVGATLRHVLHCQPEVPTGNMTQLLINTSCFGFFPFHLSKSPTGAFWDHLPNELLVLVSLAQGLPLEGTGTS